MSTSFVGRRIPGETVRVRRDPLRVPLWLLLPWWLIKITVRLLLIIARTPELLVLSVVLVLDVVVYQRAGGGVGASGVIIALDVWLGFVTVGLMLAFPGLRRVLWSRWRYLSVYRFRWPAVMDMAGLSKHRRDGRQYEPILVSVRSTATVDRVRVRLLAAQTVDDFAKASDGLRQSFSAADVRVRSVPGRPREVECLFLIDDPLTEIVEPTHEVPVRLDGLAVGRREDGGLARLAVLGHHILVDGCSGSGKSGGEWAIVHALAPAIADGTVALWGVDPKKMELGFGEALFARLAYRDAAEIAALLDEAVAVMQARQDRLRGVVRLHKPSAAEPLIVVLVDELAALAFITDRDLRKRIDSALGLLLSQGRAVGVSVIGCIQDARKDTLPARGLYTVRVLLRVTEAEEVGLVFSPGAYDRGARADKISPALQGVAFVEVDGEPEPVRMRFAYVTDEDIEGLSAGWRPPLTLVPAGNRVPATEDDAA